MSERLTTHEAFSISYLSYPPEPWREIEHTKVRMPVEGVPSGRSTESVKTVDLRLDVHEITIAGVTYVSQTFHGITDGVVYFFISSVETK